MVRSKARRQRRLHRIAQALMALALVPVAVAHMAQNAVPETFAGVTASQMSAQTVLAVSDNAMVGGVQHHGQDHYQFTNLSATLTTVGAGVPGQGVAFVVQGITVCTDVTDHRGVASCSGDTQAVADFPAVPSQLSAVFIGNGLLLPATTTVNIRKIAAGGAALNEEDVDD